MPCGLEEVFCPGGLDGLTGCPKPNTCMPVTGNCLGKLIISEDFTKKSFPIGPIGADGNACPVVCPAACGIAEQSCPGGVDSNGCMMPDVCTPMTGNI